MKRSKRTLGVCGLVAVGVSASASADILHDTTGIAINSSHLVGQSMVSDVINQPADSIVVSGGDFFLESITVRLNGSQLVGAVGDDYEIRFWGNDLDRPGALLETFTVSDSASLSFEDVTVLSGGGVLLEEGETFWVSVALPDDMSSGSWSTVDADSLGRAVAFSGDDDAPWIPIAGGSATYLQVTGIPVPSPGTLALFGLGGLVASRRR